MILFLREYCWTILILITLGFSGGFAVIPFRNTHKYTLFFSPLAGLLILILGISACYSVFELKLSSAIILSLTLTISVTILTLLYTHSFSLKLDFKLISFIALMVAIIVYTTNYTSIEKGNFGFLFIDGSDHLGYAHMADWLRMHLTQDVPILSQKYPYQSFIRLLLEIDPRFGSHFTLASIAEVRSLSAMFAYDPACCVVLSAGFLAIAAVFSRSPFTFMLLLIGLFTSVWFGYSRAGYFGKILGYPASLFTIGLFMTARRPIPASVIAVLVVFSCAATIVHSFLSTGLFFIVIGGLYILIHVLFAIIEKRNNIILESRDNIVLVAMLVGVSLVSTGILSHPLPIVGFPLTIGAGGEFKMEWLYLLPRLLDLENYGPTISNLSSIQMQIGITIFFIVTVFLIYIALKIRDLISIALIAGPLILVLFLVCLSNKWPLYQMSGFVYPCILCATIRLLDDSFPSSENSHLRLMFRITLALYILNLFLHLPQSIGAFKRYAGHHIIKSLQYSRSDFDQITNLIRDQKVLVNLTATNFSLPILVELGRRGTKLEWTPKAWKSIVDYRHWPAPTMDQNIHYLIEDKDSTPQKGCEVKFTTAQYNLFYCNKINTQK